MPNRLAALVALFAVAVLMSPSLAQKAKGKVIKADREWVEIINDTKLAKEAPKDGYITDAKAFEKLWKSWRKDEKVPEIDFKKKIVVITLSEGGPNKPGCTARLTDEGDLVVTAVSTLIGGEAFGYSIGVYPSAGVKKVNGKALAAK